MKMPTLFSSRRRGFTLLEMLVVLVLLGLISTLLLQGFVYIINLRLRVLTHLDDLQRGTLQEYWFRSTTAAILADYQEGKYIFKGNQREFSGLTAAPLDASVGSLSPFAWQLQYKNSITTLSYRKNDDEYWEIAHWAGDKGAFSYMDTKGKWYNQWPPQFFSQFPPQLPSVILFVGQRRQTPISWMVSLSDRNMTKRDPRLDGW